MCITGRQTVSIVKTAQSLSLYKKEEKSLQFRAVQHKYDFFAKDTPVSLESLSKIGVLAECGIRPPPTHYRFYNAKYLSDILLNMS